MLLDLEISSKAYRLGLSRAIPKISPEKMPTAVRSVVIIAKSPTKSYVTRSVPIAQAQVNNKRRIRAERPFSGASTTYLPANALNQINYRSFPR